MHVGRRQVPMIGFFERDGSVGRFHAPVADKASVYKMTTDNIAQVGLHTDGTLGPMPLRCRAKGRAHSRHARLILVARSFWLPLLSGRDGFSSLPELYLGLWLVTDRSRTPQGGLKAPHRLFLAVHVRPSCHWRL